MLDVDGLRVDICKAIHGDPTNIGFRFHTEYRSVSYVSDIEYGDELADQYVGFRVFPTCNNTHRQPHQVPPVHRRHRHVRGKGEARTDDLHTSGVVIIHRGPESETESVERATGIRTIAAMDLMTLDAGEELVIKDAEAHESGLI